MSSEEKVTVEETIPEEITENALGVSANAGSAEEVGTVGASPLGIGNCIPIPLNPTPPNPNPQPVAPQAKVSQPTGTASFVLDTSPLVTPVDADTVKKATFVRRLNSIDGNRDKFGQLNSTDITSEVTITVTPIGNTRQFTISVNSTKVPTGTFIIVIVRTGKRHENGTPADAAAFAVGYLK